MKKIIMLLIVITLMPFLVQANENISEEEAKALDYQEGLEVRLLQLEKAIRANYLKMDEVIQRSNGSEDLKEKQKELESLLVVVEDFEYVQKEEAITKYAEYRRLANTISKEFRELAHQKFNEDQRNEIREIARQRSAERLREFSAEIKESIRNYNAKILQEKVQILNISSEEIEQIVSGDLSVEQIRNLVSEKRASLTDEKKAMLEDHRRQRLEIAKQRREAISSARESIAREAISNSRPEIDADNTRRSINNNERVREIARDRYERSNMYRLSLEEGQSHEILEYSIELESLNQRQATFLIKTPQDTTTHVININERKPIRNAYYIGYASYQSPSGVFIIGKMNEDNDRRLLQRNDASNRAKRNVASNVGSEETSNVGGRR